MAIKRPKGGADIPGQEYVPQVDRYTGSDVLGMERTTARPMGFETGANPKVPMPGRAWTEDCPATMHWKSSNPGMFKGGGK